MNTVKHLSSQWMALGCFGMIKIIFWITMHTNLLHHCPGSHIWDGCERDNLI